MVGRWDVGTLYGWFRTSSPAHVDSVVSSNMVDKGVGGEVGLNPSAIALDSIDHWG